MLVGVGTTVLPNVPGSEPNPNFTVYLPLLVTGIAAVVFISLAIGRHVHRRYWYAHDWLFGSPVRRDRPESAILDFLLPLVGALLQEMVQIGWAIGLSVSTIVFNAVLGAQSSRLGVILCAER